MDHRHYFGCKINQRIAMETIAFFVFTARVKDVKNWVGVKRSREYSEGTQRILREGRKKAIVRFLAKEAINTIPNNILLAFEPEVAHFRSTDEAIRNCCEGADIKNGCTEQIEWGFLEFSFEENLPENLKPALIVDGQHRFFGMVGYEQENLPAIFVCLLDAPLNEQAFQFIVINSKAVKVPVDNAKAIIEGVDDELLRDRLLRSGVSYANISPLLSEVNDLPNSPFRDMLDWDYNRNGPKVFTLTTIEQCLRYNESIFAFLGDDEDSRLELFFSIWNAVRHYFPQYFENITEENKEQNKFIKKVNINALNEFLTERLKKAWEFELVTLFNSSDVEKCIGEILEKINPQFWQYQWTIVIQDNSNVRKLIKLDLEAMIQNHNLGRSWADDLELPIISE
jgi:DGQHR domain-containing protein